MLRQPRDDPGDDIPLGTSSAVLVNGDVTVRELVDARLVGLEVEPQVRPELRWYGLAQARPGIDPIADDLTRGSELPEARDNFFGQRVDILRSQRLRATAASCDHLAPVVDKHPRVGVGQRLNRLRVGSFHQTKPVRLEQARGRVSKLDWVPSGQSALRRSRARTASAIR